jgi:hypothetical protein
MLFAMSRWGTAISERASTCTSLKDRKPPRSSRPRPPMPIPARVMRSLAPKTFLDTTRGAAMTAAAFFKKPRRENLWTLFMPGSPFLASARSVLDEPSSVNAAAWWNLRVGRTGPTLEFSFPKEQSTRALSMSEQESRGRGWCADAERTAFQGSNLRCDPHARLAPRRAGTTIGAAQGTRNRDHHDRHVRQVQNRHVCHDHDRHERRHHNRHRETEESPPCSRSPRAS